MKYHGFEAKSICRNGIPALKPADNRMKVATTVSDVKGWYHKTGIIVKRIFKGYIP